MRAPPEIPAGGASAIRARAWLFYFERERASSEPLIIRGAPPGDPRRLEPHAARGEGIDRHDPALVREAIEDPLSRDQAEDVGQRRARLVGAEAAVGGGAGGHVD